MTAAGRLRARLAPAALADLYARAAPLAALVADLDAVALLGDELRVAVARGDVPLSPELDDVELRLCRLLVEARCGLALAADRLRLAMIERRDGDAPYVSAAVAR